MTGYISLIIKLNILNHMMILASANYSYNILYIFQVFFENKSFFNINISYHF